MNSSTADIRRAKDVLDPRVLMREGELNALWNGSVWQKISPADAIAVASEFVEVRGANVRREIVMRARTELDFWL